MKPYPLVGLNHFTVPVATTLSTVHTTAQPSYGRALTPDTAQNTKSPRTQCPLCAQKRPSFAAQRMTLCAKSGLMHRSKHHLYSITSSARASSDGGTVRPSTLAVLRLITSSNLVGCWIGRSEGLVPLRIRSTYS